MQHRGQLALHLLPLPGNLTLEVMYSPCPLSKFGGQLPFFFHGSYGLNTTTRDNKKAAEMKGAVPAKLEVSLGFVESQY